MTLPATPRRAGPFNGNDSATSFAFTFKVFADEDIRVVRTSSAGIETTLTLDSDYSVTLNGDQETNPGGSVTYPISGSPLATGQKLTIAGALEYDQPADIPTGGNFNPSALEAELDRIVMQIQQLAEESTRSIRLALSASGVSATLPVPQANQVIAWNGTGTGLENRDTPLSTDIVADTNVEVTDSTIFDGQTLDDVLALLALRGTVPAINAVNVLASSIPTGAMITALGRSAANDGGGGRFQYLSSSTQTVDGMFVFAPAVGTGRFIREGWTVLGFNGDADPRWAGAKVDATTNDSAALNLAITNCAALGLSGKLCLYGGTWKLNNGISHNSKVEVDAAGALLDFSGCTEFAAWSINSGKEIRHVKNVLHGGVMKGVATPADGVYSATTVGVQFSTSQVSISNVTVQSFAAGWYFNSNAYVIALNDCAAWYNRRGWDADQTSKSNMGADLKAYSCLFAHNDYDVYNVLCESTFFACAFDNCQAGYVEENITASGGANNGYLGFQSCRWEAGGDAATPWFKNSGYMILKEPKFYDPATYTYLFDNSGRIDIDGGLSRLTGGVYTSRNTGSGTIGFYGCRPVDFNGECFRLSPNESGFYNGDFELGTTAGWVVSTGSGANLTCVTTTPHLGTYCLQMVSGGVTFVAETWPIPLRGGCKQALVNVYAKNLNATDVAPEMRFYTATDTLISAAAETIPGNTSAWTRIRFTGAVPAGAAYFKIAVPMSAAQTLAVRLDDIYANFA